ALTPVPQPKAEIVQHLTVGLDRHHEQAPVARLPCYPFRRMRASRESQGRKRDPRRPFVVESAREIALSPGSFARRGTTVRGRLPSPRQSNRMSLSQLGIHEVSCQLAIEAVGARDADQRNLPL